jgi:hypothetical protein
MSSVLPRRVLAAAVSVASLVVVGSAGSAGAQETVTDCSGVSIDATVAAASVPGGAWSVQDTCIPADAVYEADVLGYHLVGGLGEAIYTDGHVGRVAFVTAVVGPDRSLTLVGVEDRATDSVTWAYSDGTFAQAVGSRSFGGAANAATVVSGQDAGAIVPAQVDLHVDGVGTDLATAQGPIADQIRGLLDQAVAALQR